MDEQTLRGHAEAHCEALLAGDMDRAAEDLSDALRGHLGQFVMLIPLPLTEASVEGIEAGSGHVVTLRLVGEGGVVRMATRWKDRDGRPTIVEASHIVEEPEAAPQQGAEETPAE